MSTETGPIYEVTFFIDRDIADDFGQWLEEHIRETLRIDGVLECHTFARADDERGLARRTCQYVLADDEALDRFLDGPGGDIDNSLETVFDDRATLDARVLREDVREGVSGGAPDCLNCGSYLRGQYCAVCGQRARSRLISLWELVSDAFGDLFELDSRLWQTLVPLLLRPGQLTHDYLQGRRARFMPPFRMYLVLSLLFFVVAFFDPRESLSLLFEPEAANEEAEAEAQARRQEILDELAEEGIIVGNQLPGEEGSGERQEQEFRIQLGDTESEDSCDVSEADLADLPGWLQRRLTPERLQRICERTQIDGGRAFFDKLIDNIPTALIVLLPLMAFVLKALYPLSRRYYVEHLLFFVHFHAFFFLILSLQILLLRVAAWVRIPEVIPVLAVTVASFYIPVYLFVAVRRVYGQGRFVTFVKYIPLLIAYLFGFTATMLGAVAIAALSV